MNISLSMRTTRTLMAAALAACFAAPVLANTDYYVVVPMPGKVGAAPAQSITVTLNAYTLPAATRTQAYEFSLSAALQVTGDSAFNASQVA